MVRIHLIRHGQASFHADDYDQLSDLGAEQSRLLGQWFHDCRWKVDHIVVGGMNRHMQTAEAFFDRFPHPCDWREHVFCDDGFNEFNHEDIFFRWLDANEPDALANGFRYGNMSPAEFNTKMFGALWRWAAGEHDADYREAWPAFQARCVHAFEAALALGTPGENIVAFTSGGAICAILRHVMALSAEQMVRLIWQVMNGSVTSITYKGGVYSLSGFNNTAHLDHTGRPDIVTIK